MTMGSIMFNFIKDYVPFSFPNLINLEEHFPKNYIEANGELIHAVFDDVGNYLRSSFFSKNLLDTLMCLGCVFF